MDSSNNSNKLCAILLASYNGEDFISQQIKSIKDQTHKKIKLYISDDGSIDATLDILKKAALHWNKDNFHIIKGPQKGFAENFISLLTKEEIDTDFYAFSDQDDIWQPDKIKRALEKLNDIDKNIPAIYCTRTHLIDNNGNTLGLSPYFRKPPDFKNALVQCIAGGNTMVINKAARNLLVKTKDAKVYSHDWWAYLIVTGADGKIIYDDYPSVYYRQHPQNVLGRNNNLIGKLNRIKMLFQGNFFQWNTQNLIALNQYRYLLTDNNQEILDKFIALRDKKLFGRLKDMWNCGIYRQTFLGNCGIYLAVTCKKL